MYALKLYDHHEEISQTLLKEQDDLPTVVEVVVGPTQGKLSLQLSAYGKSLVTIAEHPPLEERRLLRVYYEGPHLFEVEWVDTMSQEDRSSSPEIQLTSGVLPGSNPLTSRPPSSSGWRQI